MAQVPANERQSKKQRITLRDNDNFRWMQKEVAAIADGLKEIGSKVREDSRNLNRTLAKEELQIAEIKENIEEIALDIVDIKERLEEMASEAREEKKELNNLLEDILSEIQQRD